MDKRLAEGSRTLTKTLTGETGATIDFSKIIISHTGQIQPAKESVSTPPKAESTNK